MAPHGRSGHSCEGDHDHHETPEMGIQYGLYTKIDKENLECLNESIENSGKKVFKPWEERLNFTEYVESDADEELLFNIPFTGNIKLKGIVVIGEDSASHPSKMRLFKNRPHMTFDDVGATPEQEFDLQIDSQGSLEYSPRVVTFNTVYHLSIHFPTNFGSDKTRIYYIGLKGEFSEGHRHGVTLCTYEATPNVMDHKNVLEDHVSYRVQ
ncbi:PITH domain-containing protein GA19395 [Agrilus planipennis]|uniref:PITH domain-containing protein GA19395 n=1 Tax=Agrilus planipennis TaxID=224129 RepID=A0A1W4WGH4_AGRPL|nr:PITH domain-containing protein GA19395 [Agrilus planipennis]